MKVTSRGWKLLSILILLLAGSILFSDPLLAIASAFLIALILSSLITFLRRINKVNSVKVTPSQLEVKIRAGDSGKYFFKIYSDVPLVLRSNQRWLTCEPDRIDPPEALLSITVSSPRSGVYELKSLKAMVSDMLDILKKEVEIPLILRAEIYPRVVPWILEALRLLGEGELGFGEAPGRRKGLGTEYLWSRGYQPGDEISLIDWKATARLQEIVVKEFLEEVYAATRIIYDIRVHGPVSGDECASFFLSSVVSAAHAGLPVSITIKDGDRILVEREELAPLEALKLALAYVVKSRLTDEWNVYELVEPKSARLLLRILREIGSSAFYEVVKLEMDEMLKRIRRSLKKARTHVIYVGCILIDSAFIKELASEVLNAGGRLTVLAPPKPWLDAKNLEEAYLMYQSNQKMLRALEKLGARLSFKSADRISFQIT